MKCPRCESAMYRSNERDARTSVLLRLEVCPNCSERLDETIVSNRINPPKVTRSWGRCKNVYAKGGG